MGKLEQKLCLCIFKNISILGSAIDKRLFAKELEFSMSVNSILRKVDLLATDENGREQFIEVQLNESDVNHTKSFISLLDHSRVNFCDFVWLASEFNENVVYEIKKKIIHLNKSINIYLIKMDKVWIDRFKTCTIREFHVLDDLYQLAKFHELTLTKVGFFSNEVIINELSGNSLFLSNCSEHHHHRLLKKIICEMRRKSQYPPIHFFKNFEKSRIVIGAGADSISAILGTSPHRRTVYFSVEFNTNKEKFEKILVKTPLLQNRLNNLLIVSEDKRKLTIEIPNSNFTEKYLSEFIASSSLILLEYVYNEVTA